VGAVKKVIPIQKVRVGDAVVIDIDRLYGMGMSPYQGEKGVVVGVGVMNASISLIGYNRTLGFEQRCLKIIRDEREAALITAQVAFNL
jgi:ribosomal protein L21E